ncbi:MAG: hypothetical protein KAU38_02035, partial [Desulfobacterales bacterium]|nr:hypothetical protein [Desulfobacterales bacterium]
KIPPCPPLKKGGIPKSPPFVPPRHCQVRYHVNCMPYVALAGGKGDPPASPEREQWRAGLGGFFR